MALSNRERIGKGLEHLREGLRPFVTREMRARLGDGWEADVARRLRLPANRKGEVNLDTSALLKAMNDAWTEVFQHTLDRAERTYVHELMDVRNAYAHDKPVSSEDAERWLDTMKRLLRAVSAGPEAEEVDRLLVELKRTVYTEQARNKTRYQLQLEGMPRAGLKPWREVVTPHKDVVSGTYVQAEFAADLAQVARDEGADEYKEPGEFFRRTYVTSGLEELLVGALQRLTGKGGDPVVELQTNFGGGKTHSMLALWHLFGGSPTSAMSGLETVLERAGVKSAPKANRAALVGTDLSPGQVRAKPDGTRVHTLWGELAWQLGKKAGYALVADSDKRAVSPGAAVLGELFRTFAPCLVLIDEWVAFARQTVGKTDLPAGGFEAQSTFAQALTEAAKAAPKTLVVASIPASKIEVGGDNGQHALDTLKDIFDRVAKTWRPANADEGFEIVRRRLFERIEDRDAYANRDAVVMAFVRMYRDASAEFPGGASEEGYKRDLEAAYPIHPELFRRLYDEWSTLDQFQRTRGVLRLLAKVIHRLWDSGDQNLMILPAFVPIDDGAVRTELTHYLPDVWDPILSQDVDGDTSLPVEIDRSTPNLGRLSACRRVARVIYLGTAPGSDQKNPGMDDRAVRLGCVQPGEPPATFGDALRRLSDRAKYIHQDANRYWISTKHNLNRLADDRASGYLREPEELHAEVVKRLRGEQDARRRADFAAVHACPESSADVEDEPRARLVLLGPKHAHKRGQTDSAARTAARDILANRGSGPRVFGNCLVFLAPDQRDLDALLHAVSQYLAWDSIWNERERLNLDPFHQKQAETKRNEADSTVDLRIANCWAHALVPSQADATATVDLEEIKIAGGTDSLAKRASVKLGAEEMLLTEIGAERLRMELDKYLWKDKSHVSFGDLADWFPRYVYLPRVRGREVLLAAVRDGLNRTQIEDTFAVASSWDESAKRYRGLRLSGGMLSVVDNATLLVKPAAARAQQEAEAGAESTRAAAPGGTTPDPGSAKKGKASSAPPVQPAQPPNVFVGSVRLDPTRVGRDAGRVAEEVVQHLTTLPGAEAEVTLEIRVKVPAGVGEDVVRTVRENATTLKFGAQAFERE